MNQEEHSSFNALSELKGYLLSEEINSLEKIEENISDKIYIKEAVSNVILEARENPSSEETKALLNLIPLGLKKHVKDDPEKAIDTLFPILGPIVSKYVSEALADSLDSINDKIENQIPIESINLKIKSFLLRVPEEELIISKIRNLKPKAFMVIEKETGLIKYQKIDSDELKVNPDLFAGLITALQDFSKDCINNQDTKIDQIEYGDFQILLEQCGSSYFAIVTSGKIRLDFKRKFRKILASILSKYPNFIAEFDNPQSNVHEECSSLFLKLKENAEAPRKISFTKKAFMGLILLLLLFFPVKKVWGDWVQEKYNNVYQKLHFAESYPLSFSKSPWGAVNIEGEFFTKNQQAITKRLLTTKFKSDDFKFMTSSKAKLVINSVEHRVKTILLLVNSKNVQTNYRVTSKGIEISTYNFKKSEIDKIQELIKHYQIAKYITLK